MAKKNIQGAVKDWAIAWNAEKDKMFRKYWEHEIKNNYKPLSMKQWLACDVGKKFGIAGIGDYELIESNYPFIIDSKKTLGIVNMNDTIFYGNKYHDLFIRYETMKQKYDAYKKNVPANRILRDGNHPTPDTWEFRTSGKVNGSLLLNGRSWAVVDMGSNDPDRRGGLIKYGGYGNPEPKKYLRGHLYPETIIKKGWMPKKQLKTLLGKPYPYPLYGALKKNGSLETYGPGYY